LARETSLEPENSCHNEVIRYNRDVKIKIGSLACYGLGTLLLQLAVIICVALKIPLTRRYVHFRTITFNCPL